MKIVPALAFGVIAAVAPSFANGIQLATESKQHSTEEKPFSLLSPSLYGVDIFHNYCSPCHGRDGRGDGPVAVALNPRPAGLTPPRAQVRDFITNGTRPIPAHGTSAMPVWGPTFHALETDDRTVSIRIANVVEYLETIQK